MLLNPPKFVMISPRSRSKSNMDLTRWISVHDLNSFNIATWFLWNKSLTDMFVSTGRIWLIGCGRWAHFFTTIFKIFFLKLLVESMECLRSVRFNKYNWSHQTRLEHNYTSLISLHCEMKQFSHDLWWSQNHNFRVSLLERNLQVTRVF